MKNQIKVFLKRITAVTLALFTTVSFNPAGGLSAFAEDSSTLSNPTVVADSSMKAGQKTTWDCVWFGSYPQTEIVSSADQCGTYGNTYYGKESDYIVDADLYNQLANATGWNVSGDITLNGVQYKRIQKSDGLFYPSSDSSFYDWTTGGYHYFRFEPIKWRVLNVEGGQALLLSDIALDCQYYNTVSASVTWKTCTLRSWLNGYDGSENDQNIEYSGNNFYFKAFSADDRMAISWTDLDNTGYWNNGGDNTTDKIFLLSSSDVFKTDQALSYGFNNESVSTLSDEGRRSNSSTYAKAKGTLTMTDTIYETTHCNWWLRSTGYSQNTAIIVKYEGSVSIMGSNLDAKMRSVRPALTLDLRFVNQYCYAGTVCSDGTVNEDCGHIWTLSNTNKEATCTEEGNGTYVCSVCGETKTDVIEANGHNWEKDYTVDKEATCTEAGSKSFHCSICDATANATEIPATGHTYKTTTTKATVKANGSIVTKCTLCGNIGSSKKIYYPKTITLSKTSFVYSGKVQKPTLTVKDAAGKTIASSNYTISYSSGCKNVGKYTAKITFKGNYSGTVSKTFTIVPKGTSLKSLTAATKAFTIKWTKQATQTTGYQIQYSTSSKFTSYKTVTVSGSSTTSKKISNLSAKKKYYVRIRTYKTVSGTKYYSAWSSAKSVTTK